MLTLVNLLILFFIILIIYQIFLAYFGKSIVEGLTNDNKPDNTEYQPYDSNDPLILGKQNAGNIIVIKKELDGLIGLNQQVQDLSGNVTILQNQVNSLVEAQQQYASQVAGGTPPDITGTDATTNDDEEQDITNNM